MYKFPVLILLMLSMAIPCEARADMDSYILTIDSLLLRQNEFEMAKELRIEKIKQNRYRALNDADMYALNEMLSEEYSTYRADSALKYIEYNLDIADKTGNRDWKARTLLNKVNLLTGTGLMNEAVHEIGKINSSRLHGDALIDYYGQMMHLYSHLGNYAGGSSNQYYKKERDYKDSIMSVITPSHRDYLWYKGWDILGKDKKNNTVIEALERKLKTARFDNHDDARNAYILSRLYKYRGDMENAMKYLAFSAMADIRTANTEIASMKELAELLFDRNDIDHAYTYINYSLEKAKAFPNRVRMIGNIKTLDKINRAYQEKSRKQENRIKTGLVLLCVLALVLITTIVEIIIQNRKLKRQQRHLDEANDSLNKHVEELSKAQSLLAEANGRLRELNDDLKLKNDELNEANYVKEEYIGYVFTICSDNIRKLDNLRKSIHAKAVAGKVKDIERLSSGVNVMKEELKDFYHSFDTIFLHIYPDFVKDFNALLHEDGQVVLKEGELLNTELRIYALVRLGITDSIKIAEFLHCSPQTVYNNRFKVRSRAKVPKEKFAETVRVLGKFVNKSV